MTFGCHLYLIGMTSLTATLTWNNKYFLFRVLFGTFSFYPRTCQNSQEWTRCSLVEVFFKLRQIFVKIHIRTMLLSALVHVHSLRWVIPAAIMLGSSPTYITIWSGWRMLSSLLPQRFYIYGDDRLYSLYQRLILYFFHTYTTTEVSIC